MITISLVIATYNRAEQLLVTLSSVAEQTTMAERWECIVVDNNSKDDTRERVARFIESHPGLNIIYRFEPQQGLSYARNAGIESARGEIIAFVDDDERVAQGFFDAYIELFERHPEAMTAGGRVIAEYPAGRPRWMSRYSEQPIANPIDFGHEVKPYPQRCIPAGGNMAFRREVFQRIGVFNTELGRKGTTLIGGEESELFERIAAHNMPCYYTPGATIYHIIPSQKLTAEYFEKLCYNTGISQHRRAVLHRRIVSLYLGEVAKWGATLLLTLVHRPQQSYYLIKMRYNITRGILSR